MLQSMADASPSKWHLAHTTWFFERFVLAGFASAPAHDPAWDYLFNSYYKSIGPAHARPQRGLLSRPSLQQVRDYRQQVDAQVQSRLAAGDLDAQALHHLQLGLQHEQQHQELLLTDIKHAFWCNPLQPAYREDLQPAPALPVRRAGPNHPNASSPLAPQPGRSMPPSPTTTNRRRIACCSPHTHWQSVPSAMASTSPSSRLAATASRAGGSAKAGRCAKPRAGSTRCTGTMPCSASTPSAVGESWTRMRRSATSAITRPMPAPAGRVRACPASSSGKPPLRQPCVAILPTTISCTLGRGRAVGCGSCSATYGNGPTARMAPIRAFALSPATSVSTTASSCAGNGCCAVAAAPRRVATCVPATVTSSCPGTLAVLRAAPGQDLA